MTRECWWKVACGTYLSFNHKMIGANEHRISFDRDGTQSVNLRDRKWLVIYDGSSEAKHSEQTMLIGALIVCLAGALFLDGAGSGFCWPSWQLRRGHGRVVVVVRAYRR